MSTPNKVLSALADANEYIAIGLQIGSVLVPLAKGTIQEIRTISTGVETVKYAVLIEVDGAELDAVDKLALDDLAAINLELRVRGLPEVPVSPPPEPLPPK